jgi:hypothetical protein
MWRDEYSEYDAGADKANVDQDRKAGVGMAVRYVTGTVETNIWRLLKGAGRAWMDGAAACGAAMCGQAFPCQEAKSKPAGEETELDRILQHQDQSIEEFFGWLGAQFERADSRSGDAKSHDAKSHGEEQHPWSQ